MKFALDEKGIDGMKIDFLIRGQWHTFFCVTRDWPLHWTLAQAVIKTINGHEAEVIAKPVKVAFYTKGSEKVCFPAFKTVIKRRRAKSAP